MKINPAQLTAVNPLRPSAKSGQEQVEGARKLQDAYRDFVGKTITVMLKEERIRQVSMCGVEFPEFSRAYGAIKLIASVAAPEVVNGGFFQRI